MNLRFMRAVSRAASFSTLARSAPVKPGVRLATDAQVDVGGDRLVGAVDAEDLQPALHVGRLDGDLAVEAARTQQGGVEHVGAVGRGDQHHAAVHVEAVHLDQQLVQGLLALVVAAAHAGAAVASDGVDLVDEDDGRRGFLGLLEQVADAGGANTDEHLDEVGTRDREERDAGLAGHGPGQQGLAGAGRTVQQDALGDLGADGGELGRLGQELADLLELLDRLLTAGDIAEGGLRGVLARELRLRLAEAEHLVAAALDVVEHHEEQDPDDRGTAGC